MKSHLFLFTLGPVQSFIAQARKTQDLYAGSRILGELIYAASQLAKQNNIDLIFPKEIEKNASVPNRFLGKIIEKSDAELQQIGQRIEDAARYKFRELAQNALLESKVNLHGKLSDAFKQQIENHLEINWLFHPVEENDDKAYRTAYAEIETLMGSLKNVRTFEQFNYNGLGEAGRKCSLDGERNALVFGNGTEGRYAKQGVLLRKNDVRANQNEGLSAISLTKRFFEDESVKIFSSTAEVAALNIIAKTPGIYSVFKKCFGGEIDDAQLFYKENLTEKYLKKNGYEDVLNVCDISTLKNCLKDVFQGNEPPSYFALVAFDGDKMGKILSGDSEIFQGDDLQKYQGEVSGKLSAFAKFVNEYFSKKDKGTVAYAGGDDFLGFVNLVSLFEVMRWLRTEFHNQVSKPLSDAGYFKSGVKFTFSAGIAIAHYKMPLSMVLDKARAMEKKAKSKKGGDRDAFAISVIKKSGESHETYYHWELDEDLKHWKALEELVGYFENGYCSETFVRNLSREFYTLQDKEGNITDSGMVKMELMRLVKRSMTDKGKKAKMTEQVQKKIEDLMITKETRIDGNFHLERLTNAISIALFLKRNRKHKPSNEKIQNQ